jgi:hypothetical protein
MTRFAAACLARQVAQVAVSFEHRLLGRAPGSVTVTAGTGWMTVSIHQPLAPVERGLARRALGAARVRALHRDLFEESQGALIAEVRRRTGLALHGGIAHVDAVTGSILKTFTTAPCIDLFVFGAGLPALGVPLEAHVHARGGAGRGTGGPGLAGPGITNHGINGSATSGGIGAVRV